VSADGCDKESIYMSSILGLERSRNLVCYLTSPPQVEGTAATTAAGDGPSTTGGEGPVVVNHRHSRPTALLHGLLGTVLVLAGIATFLYLFFFWKLPWTKKKRPHHRRPLRCLARSNDHPNPADTAMSNSSHGSLHLSSGDLSWFVGSGDAGVSPGGGGGAGGHHRQQHRRTTSRDDPLGECVYQPHRSADALFLVGATSELEPTINLVTLTGRRTSIS
jgi:hypothetical protein